VSGSICTSASLASNSISPLKKNIHMRMGDGWVSPDPTAGSLRNPHCDAGASSETKNGVAGGANPANDVVDRARSATRHLVFGTQPNEIEWRQSSKSPSAQMAKCGNLTAGAMVENTQIRVPHRSNGILNERSAQRRESETTGVRSLSSTTFWHRLHCKR